MRSVSHQGLTVAFDILERNKKLSVNISIPGISSKSEFDDLVDYDYSWDIPVDNAIKINYRCSKLNLWEDYELPQQKIFISRPIFKSATNKHNDYTFFYTVYDLDKSLQYEIYLDQAFNPSVVDILDLNDLLHLQRTVVKKFNYAHG